MRFNKRNQLMFRAEQLSVGAAGRLADLPDVLLVQRSGCVLNVNQYYLQEEERGGVSL